MMNLLALMNVNAMKRYHSGNHSTPSLYESLVQTLKYMSYNPDLVKEMGNR